MTKQGRSALRDQRVVRSKGFGFADAERRIPAVPETLYHVASLTKPLAATLLLQLAEQGKLDLDEPMSRYSADFKDSGVRVKHLLSHTPEGTPGERYNYNGERLVASQFVVPPLGGISIPPKRGITNWRTTGPLRTLTDCRYRP